MKEFMIVGMGGFLGAGIRYTIGLIPWSEKIFQKGTATLIANLLGCLLFGLFFVYISKLENFALAYRNFFLVGFCGGLTTFSSYIFDFYGYIEDGSYLQGVLYILASTILGLLVFFLGLSLGKNIFIN